LNVGPSVTPVSIQPIIFKSLIVAMRHIALGSVLLLASAQLALAAIIPVTVGGPGVLKFEPEFVTAAVGDSVVFTFRQKNHTVTQSSFLDPCVRLANGFDSGFLPVPDNETRFPTAVINVTRTAPIWAYCRQGTHCRAGMVFAINTNASAFAAFKAAATGGTPSVSPSAPLPTPSSTNHNIAVGATGLTFEPSNITAQVGDTITFEFRAKNHTVTGSSFGDPCTAQGFDSGFKPVPSGSSNFPTYVLKVNDTKPIWAYCRQATHCREGMVFGVNTVESGPQNFAAFQALARNQSSSSSPGPYSNPSAAWRPAVGSSSIAIILGLSAAALLL
jgi:plastocyanin